ncbi:hypothetical protein SCHPADRAFT_929251 [Schizopora paradoxa]|uniref:Uncharacterized protein n=1 Tax=Schizopora paradoxa TaxID=27342 RepID=A0A0H2RKQ1_9AGAM|nr:hypothetical protein SCHPADRAFT_929251 [Schizopora paradoxa]
MCCDWISSAGARIRAEALGTNLDWKELEKERDGKDRRGTRVSSLVAFRCSFQHFALLAPSWLVAASIVVEEKEAGREKVLQWIRLVECKVSVFNPDGKRFCGWKMKVHAVKTLFGPWFGTPKMDLKTSPPSSSRAPALPDNGIGKCDASPAAPPTSTLRDAQA